LVKLHPAPRRCSPLQHHPRANSRPWFARGKQLEMVSGPGNEPALRQNDAAAASGTSQASRPLAGRCARRMNTESVGCKERRAYAMAPMNCAAPLTGRETGPARACSLDRSTQSAAGRAEPPARDIRASLQGTAWRRARPDGKPCSIPALDSPAVAAEPCWSSNKLWWGAGSLTLLAEMFRRPC